MAIKQERKWIYTCTDGTEFTDEQKARDYEFRTLCSVGSMNLNNLRDLQDWLKKNRSIVMEYLQHSPDVRGEEAAPDDES